MRPSRFAALSLLPALALGCRAKPPAPASIEDIQYAAVAVDLQKDSLRTETRGVSNTRTGGGTIIERYRAGGTMRKVVARMYDEVGQTQESYYLHDGRPYLLVRRMIWYNSGRSIAHLLTDSLYYGKGTLLRAVSVDSPSVGSEIRQISTPLDSATARLEKFLSLKDAR